MTRTNMPHEDADAERRRTGQPRDARADRHAAQEEAAGRNDVPPARLGAELSAEKRPADETETADALKRAAENDRRV